MDIATLNDASTSCFTKSYSRYHKGAGSVLLMPTDDLNADEAKDGCNYGGSKQYAEEATPASDGKEQQHSLKRPLTPESRVEPCNKKQGLLEDPSARSEEHTAELQSLMH